MQYRKMPKGTDELSALGFGCMRLPGKGGDSMISSVDMAAAKELVVHAIENGVNYLDTAWPYHRGDSERFLGEHIVPEYRDRIYIATKLPSFSVNTRERMDEIFEKQRERLRVDVIDYYLMHSLNGRLWDKMVGLGAKDFLDGLRASGKVRHVGFSFHGDADEFIRIVDDYDWEFVQVQMNILDENFQAGLAGIRYAAEKELGVIVMEPLRGGSLVRSMPKSVREVYDKAPVKKTPAEWAFSWLYDMPEVTVVLSGMHEKGDVDENLRIADKAVANGFGPQEKAVVGAAKDAFLDAMEIACTGCAYCMPCPQGINIPGNLKDLNDYHMFGRLGAKMMHWQYIGMRADKDGPKWAGSCIQCGKCEKKCPQNLKIMDALAQTAKRLEGPFGKVISAIGRRVMN